ncbi:hypothetical protein AGABI1DRAFT_133615 [Agaricus bisporus var. burnettii JB137-S8]|uniref:Uncharacterized protein n=1 Tax=Agaricus bisporus var. burnettii (strain JB137-S8 / ATCC MYA-4627 / FGSC 10392) TaxID=597362 RepID=K5VIH5_AGABU|nr:uncharacterized protein AGABI1DRAFT_133615 [Agaricus bisporus var. burnettii JB137-S8]EKM74119.1 hypothetical protein AGABI1DRAFT_133615 [Agaricus bisporus var. burnettii JB137-S8]
MSSVTESDSCSPFDTPSDNWSDFALVDGVRVPLFQNQQGVVQWQQENPYIEHPDAKYVLGRDFKPLPRPINVTKQGEDASSSHVAEREVEVIDVDSKAFKEVEVIDVDSGVPREVKIIDVDSGASKGRDTNPLGFSTRSVVHMGVVSGERVVRVDQGVQTDCDNEKKTSDNRPQKRKRDKCVMVEEDVNADKHNKRDYLDFGVSIERKSNKIRLVVEI